MSTPHVVPGHANVDRALAALEWTTRDSRRVLVEPGVGMLLSGRSAGFAYVAAGTGTVDDKSLTVGDIVLWPHGFHARVRAWTDLELVHLTVDPAGPPGPALGALPDTIVVHGFDVAEPAVAGLVAMLACGPVSAVPHARAGDLVICSRIATTVVSVVVRAWLERGCAPRLWADRLADPDLSRAIDAMHDDPGKPWTVDGLARSAAMSRSAFAERFRELTGTSPVSYLTEVRMDAAMRLLDDGHPVAATAHRLGYESEAGFSRAFRRHTGLPPARWRRRTVSAS